MALVPYSAQDFGRRLLALLPQSWLGQNATTSTGNPDTNGLFLALCQGIGSGFATIYAALVYVKNQTRLLTMTDVNLDNRAADFFGFGNFLRGLSETDAAYAIRIQQRTIAPLPTLRGIQEIVTAYITAVATANLTEPLGLDTEGAIDTVGALDGGAFASAASALPQVVVFDTQSNPTLAAQVGLIAADAQFCIAFYFGEAAQPAWLLGSSYLGSTTYLGTQTLYTTSPPSGGIDALVRQIKAVGSQPVYAANIQGGEGL